LCDEWVPDGQRSHPDYSLLWVSQEASNSGSGSANRPLFIRELSGHCFDRVPTEIKTGADREKSFFKVQFPEISQSSAICTKIEKRLFQRL
jgi:hypothetical protein